MKLNPFITALALLLLAGPVRADETHSDHTGDPENRGSSFEIAPEVSIIDAETFVLSHGGFVVPYSAAAGMKTLSLSAIRPIGRVQNLQFSLMTSLGYGTIQGDYGYSYNGVPSTNQIRLTWIPVSAALRMELLTPRIIKPWINFGSGIQWIDQSVNLSGLNHCFWMPEWYTGTGLTFFQQENPDWFGSFNFGITYHHELASQQVFRAWSLDFSVNLVL